MTSLATWFIHGEIDWDWWQENARKWSPVVSGALFGAGKLKRSTGLFFVFIERGAGFARS